MIKANKQIIDIFKNLFEEVGPVVIEEGKKAMDEIAKNTKEQVKEFIERLNTEVAVDYIKVELLNSTKLIALAKENTVDGANEVYKIDLTNMQQTLLSPAYYLQQNDMVYVAPNSKRKRESTEMSNALHSPYLWLSVASFFASLIAIFK